MFFFIKDIRYYTLASKATKEAASKSKVDISNVFAQIERLASDAERERQNMQSLRESWRKEKERNEKLEKEIIQLKKKNKKLLAGIIIVVVAAMLLTTVLAALL